MESVDSRSSIVEPVTSPQDGWFTRLVEPLLPDLYGAALRLVRDEADAEDLVSEAVARAWTHRGTLERHEALRGWIYCILMNCFRGRRRAEKGRPEEPYTEEPDEDTGFSLFERLHQPILLWWGNPEREFLNKLLREDLERAIDSLPERFRVVVILADLEALPYKEIAEALAIPLGTVRSRLARGRSLLQQALWKHAVDAGLRQPTPMEAKSRDARESAM